MADDFKVNVEGLAKLNKAFKQVDVELPKKLKVKFRAISENMAAEVRGKIPHQSGNAAASVKARATTRGAQLVYAGTKAPYLPWLNFGGTTGRGHQKGGGGAIKRDIVKPDRYVYSTVIARMPSTAEAAIRAIDEVARDADFETH
jgi:hypothetical protein